VIAARTAKVPLSYRCLAWILRPILMAVTKRDWRGVENLPKEGGFVVSTNHISYADPLVFAHFMYASGRVTFFKRKDSVINLQNGD
jgi:1-acyl-sn-glycerol-3-phosphate acyltransferase